MDISSLFKTLKGIELRADNTPFNMLHVLYQDIKRKEKAHDKLLAGLLDPNGNHGLGHFPLNIFLNEIGLKNVTLDKENVVKVEQPRPVKVKINGRDRDLEIDIFISWKDNNSKCAIIIEDKLHGADDQTYESENGKIYQLQAYYNGIEDDYDVKKALYMPFSKKEKSCKKQGLTKKLDDVAKDFYAKDIVEWIEKCIKEAKKTDKNVGLLEQYKEFFKCLMNKEFLNMTAEKILDKIGYDLDKIIWIENLAKIVISEKWIETRMELIVKEVKEYFKKMKVKLPEEIDVNSERILFRYDTYEDWVEIENYDKTGGFFLYIVSKRKKKSMEYANKFYEHYISQNKNNYYYDKTEILGNLVNHTYLDYKKLIKDLVPILRELSEYKPKST